LSFSAFAGRQELLQPLAVGLLGLLVAMSRVVELQASPLLRIDGVRLLSLKFAVGRRQFVNGFMNGFVNRFVGDFVGDERPVRSVRVPSRAGMDRRGTVGC
jgi:hypothetical protein